MHLDIAKSPYILIPSSESSDDAYDSVGAHDTSDARPISCGQSPTSSCEVRYLPRQILMIKTSELLWSMSGRLHLLQNERADIL